MKSQDAQPSGLAQPPALSKALRRPRFPLGRALACVAFGLLLVAAFALPHIVWKSGQGSPVHDSDRLYPIGPRFIVLQNSRISLAFDQRTGALVRFTNKDTGWQWQTKPSLGASFMLFVPTPDRSYNPVLGARNALASYQESPDGTTLHLVWSNLLSEYQGRLNIVLDGAVHLEADQVRFDMDVVNRSPHTIASLSWPILGSIAEPEADLKLSAPNYGGMSVFRLWNPASDSEGYYGTNYPTRMQGGRFVLVSTPTQGLYIGAHNPDAEENVRFMFEVKPGYEDSYDSRNPTAPAISGHPVRLTMRVVHFPFLHSGESGPLAPVVLAPYQGDWHNGVDIYKRWLKTWFHPLPMPAWVQQVNAWQQLQIDSSEDDLRTRYADLPARVAEDAKHGITALQLTGWSRGGQDRGNPSESTDPRLGATAQLKEAIAQIQKTGVHVILFGKYAWADTTTAWYKKVLYKYMCTDPYGNIYTWAGYRYQTPEQLTGMNPRNFATGCSNNPQWRAILAGEFQKIIDLGASGVLWDEAQHGHTSLYNECFNPNQSGHVPATIWSGDIRLADMYRKMIRNSVGEKNFLFAGEDPEDVIAGAYSLTYIRIHSGYIPFERYAFPFRPVMIAATGFDDREMINRALMYRYIVSYEPFNFKGNIDDFPLTVAYGQKMDELRERYKDYLWDAEFLDTLTANVDVDGAQYRAYSVFRRPNGLRAVIVTNTLTDRPIRAKVSFDPPEAHSITCASPERPDAVPCGSTVTIPPRSVVVMMQH